MKINPSDHTQARQCTKECMSKENERDRNIIYNNKLVNLVDSLAKNLRLFRHISSSYTWKNGTCNNYECN